MAKTGPQDHWDPPPDADEVNLSVQQVQRARDDMDESLLSGDRVDQQAARQRWLDAADVAEKIERDYRTQGR